MYLFIVHKDMFFFIAMESILLWNIYRNIKFNIKFFPPNKISTGKNYVLHLQSRPFRFPPISDTRKLLFLT
jgi:hypothetical protein